jgi:hypothetical protein
VQNGYGDAIRSPLDRFSTEKGVPGDGDALLLLASADSFHWHSYFVIVPQAMRSPALPAGSVFMSSALA